MRRLVVALLAAALALTLAACGGGNETATTGTETQGGGTAAPPPVVAPAGNEDVIPDRSPTETVSFMPLTDLATDLPSSVVARLQKKQPMLIFVYDNTQKASSATRAEIDRAMKSYRGLIDLVTFDAARYVTTDPETGAITVDSKLQTDAEASKVVSMIDQLNITFTPFIIITDSNGIETWRSRGFTEQQLIEREILRATQ